MNIYGAILGLGIALTALGALGTITVGATQIDDNGISLRVLAFTIPAIIVGATLIGATAQGAGA